MLHFYTAINESILTSSITVWYADATAKDEIGLQCILRSAEKVIVCTFPSLQENGQPSHLGHRLFDTLPSWQEAVVHQDQNLPPHEQFLPLCSWDL